MLLILQHSMMLANNPSKSTCTQILQFFPFLYWLCLLLLEIQINTTETYLSLNLEEHLQEKCTPTIPCIVLYNTQLDRIETSHLYHCCFDNADPTNSSRGI